jgi:hypothetical protein
MTKLFRKETFLLNLMIVSVIYCQYFSSLDQMESLIDISVNISTYLTQTSHNNIFSDESIEE